MAWMRKNGEMSHLDASRKECSVLLDGAANGNGGLESADGNSVAERIAFASTEPCEQILIRHEAFSGMTVK